MASQSASILIGVTLSNTSKKTGKQSAQIVTGALEQPQPYSGGSGVIQGANSKIKIQLPHIGQVFGKVNDDGSVTIGKDWYRFFHDLFNQRLGGPQGDSIPDLSTTVVATRAQAISATNGVSTLSQQADANAQALAATVQVAQNNSLAGSSQIPPVVYSSGKGQMQR